MAKILREVSDSLENMLLLVIFQTFSNVTYYDYPDSDFCHFKDFPHKRLVLPRLKPIYKSECSCTELFLIHQSFKLSTEVDFFTDNLIDDYYLLTQFYVNEITEKKFTKCFNPNISNRIKECNFGKRLNNCRFQGIQKNNQDDFVNW